MKTTGERLRRWRARSGLSQEDAARVFGCTVGAVKKWEADEVEPTGDGLVYRKKVEKILGRHEAHWEECFAEARGVGDGR